MNRDGIVACFHGPGIDPPSLDNGDDVYGWVSQSGKDLPDRITPAAVLVPLVERHAGTNIVLTQRPSHLNSHAGQVSFPGGKVEKADAHAEDTALREAEEEIGLPRCQVDVVGRLGTRTTGSGFKVTPVVGIVDPAAAFVPDPGEVATIFEVPLDFVLDNLNHKIETRLIRGVERQFYVLPFQDYYIWGLTARLLVALSATLKQK